MLICRSNIKKKKGGGEGVGRICSACLLRGRKCLKLYKPECYLHQNELTISVVWSGCRLRMWLPDTFFVFVIPVSGLRCD